VVFGGAVTGGNARSLPIPCQNPALDEGFERLALRLVAAHHVRVDPQRERRIGGAFWPPRGDGC